MFFTLLIAMLPLCRALPQGPPGELDSATPDPHWDGPSPDSTWNGPTPHDSWDGPKPHASWDGPTPNPDWDGPRRKESEADAGSQSLARPENTTVAPPASDLKVTILADTNRDGKVDVTGETDLAGKETWTTKSGALFLANIGDTDSRCAKLLESSLFQHQGFGACHDAADDIQRAPQYMASIRTVPIANLRPSAAGTISVSDKTAQRLVRIFRPQSDGSWQIVKNDTTFSAEELKQGLNLGIDAREPRTPGLWDGRAKVSFTVNDVNQTSTDSVMLRVAPLITHHHNQQVEQIFVSDLLQGQQKATIDAVDKIVQASYLKSPIQRLPGPDEGNNPFVQDWFESAYMSIPGPEKPLVLRIFVLVQNDKNYELSKVLRKSGVGIANWAGKFSPEEWFGNLETIPPYEFNGKKYPTGRVIIGSVDGTPGVPATVEYFRAQELQDPLILDPTWLLTAHVDEFIQFLPAKTARGWCMMINDPMAGLQILKEAQANGLGDLSVISFKESDGRVPDGATVDKYLNTDSHLRAAATSAQIIDKTINIMKKETSIEEGEIFRVPALYVPAGDSWGERRKDKLTAYLPATINGLVLDDSLYIAPKPFGPRNNATGVDLFEEAVRNVYGKVGYKVEFIDDWKIHEVHGDIHCATNSIRSTSGAWWEE